MNDRNYHLLETSLDNQSSNITGLKTIQDIVALALQRIKMIKEIEQEESQSVLGNRDVNYYKIRLNNDFIMKEEANKGSIIAREVISHFLCKMAYAFYAEPEQWEVFARAEAIILYDKLKTQDLKIEEMNRKTYEQALHKIRTVFSFKNLGEKQREQDSYRRLYGENQDILEKSLIMFKFFDHPALLKQNYVVLHKGYVIIRKIDKSEVIKNIFIQRLLSEMKVLQQKFQNNGSKLDDDRLSFLKDLHKAEVQNDTTQFNSTAIHANELDRLAKRDMPACMTYLMSGLNEKHHLKHFGRLQLGLFLKGAGLSLNEALSFWQTKFSRTAADDFKKKYEYNIKHNYGKLGKQLDYTPMSCTKIIQHQPLNDEYHGCPYKTLESKKLKAFLKLNYNISEENYQDIEVLKKNKSYQLACRKVFELKNYSKDRKADDYQRICEKVGNHPNAYFEQSLRMYEPYRFAKPDDKKQMQGNSNNSAQKQNIRKNNEMDLEF